jgi:hypothetical protein
LLEYYIKTLNPQSHINVCETISILGIQILEDGFSPREEETYGFFKLRSDDFAFEVLSDLSDVTLELPKDRTIR